MIHPHWIGYLHRIGSLAGFPVFAVELPGTAHPDHPRPLSDVGGWQQWVKIGAAPWRLASRLALVMRWLDPYGSPWAPSEMVDVLVEMGFPDPGAGDWPAGCLAPGDCRLREHYAVHLPAAQRAAAERYAALILGAAP